MLTIYGKRDQATPFCDGSTRRSFLTIGGMALGGLSLPQILRAEAANPAVSSHKALIHVFLPGGPPHQDMWDLKPEAPAEIRGEFKPISTNIAGLQIGELFPKIAAQMDRYTVIRSIVGARGPHYSKQCMIGSPVTGPAADKIPSLGAWVSRLEGPVHSEVPPNLSMFYRTRHAPWGKAEGGGFLGDHHAPYGLVEHVDPTVSVKDEKAVQPSANNLVLRDVTLDRLQDRSKLLSSIDALRRELDRGAQLSARDTFTDQALSILTSNRLADALDISREDPKTVERYGKSIPEHLADSAPRMTTNFLIARRLVEAGARGVSMNFGRWDWHGNNFGQGRREMPMIDNGISSLVQDLYDRGMEQDVSVIVWGEFGRTPKVNKGAGRDHWPRVNSALLAGGAMRTGQAIGATDKNADTVVDRPITFEEVHATLYHALGIDPHATVRDSQGRPHYPVDLKYGPIAELV